MQMSANEGVKTISGRDICGSGKLYDTEGRLVALVTHRVWERANGGGAGWDGEFVIDRVIWPSGEYVLELEDGRRGRCVIDIEQAIIRCPVNYRYSVKGKGPLAGC